MSIFELKVNVPNSNSPVHIYCHGFDCGSQNILFSGAAPPSVYCLYMYYSKSQKCEYFPRVNNFRKQTNRGFNQKPKFLPQCAREHVDSMRVFTFCLKTFNMAETQHGGRDCTKLWLYNSEANEPSPCRSLDNRPSNNIYACKNIIA